MKATPQSARAALPARKLVVALLLPAAFAAAMSACTAPRAGAEFNDPYEAQNRAVHKANREIDQALFGGGGRKGVVPTLPEPVARGLGNFSANLAAPRNVVNSALQGKVEPVVTNTFRFLINSTLGIGGLFDPATGIGIPRQDTDFGATLAAWGVPEGAYLELPLAGPSTERDAVGKLADFVLDPVNSAVGRPESDYITAGRIGGAIGNRQRFADTYESILYGSADSYAQARLLYLQNRRFQLGEQTDTYDPYGDPYAE